MHRPKHFSEHLTRHTVSSSRKTNSFISRDKTREIFQRNKSKGSFVTKQFQCTFSRNDSYNASSSSKPPGASVIDPKENTLAAKPSKNRLKVTASETMNQKKLASITENTFQ